ncbi:MAG: agmatine deiminase family protein [Candidatus Binataceae bacterium]
MSPIPDRDRARFGAYRMPAEWEPHLATYLVWPHNLDTWPGKFEPIPPRFAQIAVAIASFERLRLIVNDNGEIERVRSMIEKAAKAADGTGFEAVMRRIETFALATNDSWVRDHGPIFVNKIDPAAPGPAQIALDWKFNSWGEKYGRFDLDDVVPQRLGARFGFEVAEPGIVLEGGSIDPNGAGSILTTESCLLNRNRNPRLTRAEIEDYLRTYLGASNVLWLGEGIAGDDTDGHIDDLARFVARDTVVTVVEEDPAAANHKILRDNLARLVAMRDERGHPLRIEQLPMPPPVVHEGTLLPASYANFYIANGGIVIPTFDCPADATAAATLARLFPGRRVIGIPSVDLVWGLGAIHCLTQQHPSARIA